MGLTVVSFTIKEIKDSVGYLEALGRKRTAETMRDADIGVAHAKKETQIQQAQAQRDANCPGASSRRGRQSQTGSRYSGCGSTKNFAVSQAQYRACLHTESYHRHGI